MIVRSSRPCSCRKRAVSAIGLALSAFMIACRDGRGEGIKWTMYTEDLAASSAETATVFMARAKIRAGWYLYAVGDERRPRLRFEARGEGKAAQLMVVTSRVPMSLGAVLPGDTSSVYADTITFRLKLPQSSGMKPTQIIIHYQLCSERYCLPAQTKELIL